MLCLFAFLSAYSYSAMPASAEQLRASVGLNNASRGYLRPCNDRVWTLHPNLLLCICFLGHWTGVMLGKCVG